MGLDDKIGNKTEDLGGKAKEATGNLTGDDSLKNEGKGDQAKAGLKGAVENVTSSHCRGRHGRGQACQR